MAGELPTVTGRQLIRLLRKDGWDEKPDRTREGVFMFKRDASGVYRSTTISAKRNELKPGTLAAILGPQQTNIGREGLLELINRHGL